MAQPGFSSWEDYANSYSRGRYRWAAEPEKIIDGAVEFLLKDAKSPWRTLDWYTPLRDEDFYNPARRYFAALERRNEWVTSYVFFPIAAVVAVVVLKVTNTEINVDRLFSHSQRPPQTDPTPFPTNLPATLNATLLHKFSAIDVEFRTSRGQVLAYLLNTPSLDDKAFVAFRYGVNTTNPDKSPDRRSEFNSAIPSTLELPHDTRFLTMQVQFQDGSVSPIRRFEVPDGVRR
jgi:hypothetical protein